ncbi:MAG: DnaJ domain-containing protein [Desulfovibrionales bacterium]|nr:DnaJ domain-containing protein [Desulfovibrionales bacterium]
MNLQQCYKILRVGPDDDLDAVKKAYRDLAFKHHPDLNPNDHQAGLKFHQINTAYVTLRDVLKNQKPGDKFKTKTGANPTYSRARASSTYQKQAGKARQDKSEYKKQEFDPDARRKKFFYRQEEVLKDILNDPFARQVFEDIFNKIKRTGGKDISSIPVIKKRRLKLEWGKYKLDLDLSRGFFSGVRRWFSSQLDDEQTVYLNPIKLRPGASIRINIERKWSGPVQSVNVNLPDDYVVGRPVRLRGMGRKIGPWKGDLYLRLLAK